METATKIIPLSKTELALAYGVSLNTLNSWLKPFKKEIGQYRGKVFTPKQISIIYECIGKP